MFEATFAFAAPLSWPINRIVLQPIRNLRAQIIFVS